MCSDLSGLWQLQISHCYLWFTRKSSLFVLLLTASGLPWIVDNCLSSVKHQIIYTILSTVSPLTADGLSWTVYDFSPCCVILQSVFLLHMWFTVDSSWFIVHINSGSVCLSAVYCVQLTTHYSSISFNCCSLSQTVMIVSLMHKTHCLLWTVHNTSFIQGVASSTVCGWPCTVYNHLQCIILERICGVGTVRESESSSGFLVHFTTVPMSGFSK